MANEFTPSSSSGLYDGERGAGGKFIKPKIRRPLPSPYDRPPPNQSRDQGWISKLVSGAAKIMPSIFSRSTTNATEDLEYGDPEVEENADDVDNGCPSNLGESESAEGGYHREGVEIVGNISKADQLGQGKRNILPSGTDFSRIEQLVKEKQFSRDDANRLIDLLHSKAAWVSNVEPVVKKPNSYVQRKVEGYALAHETPRLPSKEKQESFNIAGLGTPVPLYQKTVEEEVGASPIDIARAYMGNRVSDVDTDSKGTMSKYQSDSSRNGRYASQSFGPSPPSKSSVCWPGAMSDNKFGQSTPQSVSSRNGLHQFPRSPYSRSIYSKPKSKLARPEIDTSRFQNFPSSARQQPQTPVFGQNDRVHNISGSVGPIRHMRRKFLPEASPRGSVFNHSSQNAPSPSATTSSFLPTMKNTENGALKATIESSTVNYSESSRPAFQTSNPAVRAILEHLDRHVTTPKDRPAELQLATSPEKSSSFKLTDTTLKEGMKSSSEEKPQVRNEATDAKKDAKISTTVNGTYDYQRKSANESSIFGLSNIRVKTSKKPPTSHNQSEEQAITNMPFSCIIPESLKKPPVRPSGPKPNLASIAVDKPQLRQSIFSNNSNPGFTFPVSSPFGASPEPPTPSFMPSTTAGSSPPQPKKDIHVHEIPSFSFGDKRSTPNLNFSFPSTSNALKKDEVLDIKFSFGSDRKRR